MKSITFTKDNGQFVLDGYKIVWSEGVWIPSTAEIVNKIETLPAELCTKVLLSEGIDLLSFGEELSLQDKEFETIVFTDGKTAFISPVILDGKFCMSSEDAVIAIETAIKRVVAYVNVSTEATAFIQEEKVDNVMAALTGLSVKEAVSEFHPENDTTALENRVGEIILENLLKEEEQDKDKIELLDTEELKVLKTLNKQLLILDTDRVAEMGWKKVELDIWHGGSAGFYGSMAGDIMDEYLFEEYGDDYCRDESMVAMTAFAKYKLDLFMEWLNEEVELFTSLSPECKSEFVTLDSPRFYNYRTDESHIITNAHRQAFLLTTSPKFVKSWREYVNMLVTGVDGFVPFYKLSDFYFTNIEDWEDAQVSALMSFLAKEADKDDDALEFEGWEEYLQEVN